MKGYSTTFFDAISKLEKAVRENDKEAYGRAKTTLVYLAIELERADYERDKMCEIHGISENAYRDMMRETRETADKAFVEEAKKWKK